MKVYIAKCSCSGCIPRPISQLFIYSMNHFPLASSQGQALLGFFPKAILFPQSQINDDKVLILKCSLFLKDKDFMAFFMDGVQLPQDQNHFGEAVYFLPLSFHKLVALIFYQPRKDEKHKYRNLILKKGVWALMQLKCYFSRETKICGYTSVWHKTI